MKKFRSLQEIRGDCIWRAIVQYANGDFSARDWQSEQSENIETLYRECLEWSDFAKLTFTEADFPRLWRAKAADSLLEAKKYQSNIRRVVEWLVTHNSRLADEVLQFLERYDNKI